MNRRRLYRCRHDQRLAGVASGVAEYFDVDITLVRVLWFVSIFFGGFTILLYIVMAIVVPLEPDYLPATGPWQPGSDQWGSPMNGVPGEGPGAGADAGTGTNTGATTTPGAQSAWQTGAWAGTPHRHETRGGSGIGAVFFGALLILFGSLALVDAYLPSWADQGRFLWPAFILGVGVLLVVTALRRRPTEQ